MMKFSDSTKGLIAGALAAISYGMNPLFTLPLYKVGMTPESVLVYRYAMAVALLGAMMKFAKKSFYVPLKMIIPLIIGGVLMALSSLGLFLSYHEMDAGIASTLLFIYPVLVAAIMAMFFHEKITWTTLAGIIGALAGVGILYKNGGGRPISLWGLTLVFISALSYAIYMVAVRESKLKTLSADVLTFYVMIFSIPVFLCRAKFGLELQVVPSWLGWGCVLGLGLLPTVLSFWIMAVAIRYIGATKTAILGALEPVTAVFFGVMLFNEVLTLRIALGIVVILVSVSIVITGKQFALLNRDLPRKFKNWLRSRNRFTR